MAVIWRYTLCGAALEEGKQMKLSESLSTRRLVALGGVHVDVYF